MKKQKQKEKLAKLLILGLIIVAAMAFFQLKVLNRNVSYLSIISLGVATSLIYFINQNQKSEKLSSRELFLISIPLILANLTAHVLTISVTTLVVFGYYYFWLRRRFSKRD